MLTFLLFTLQITFDIFLIVDMDLPQNYLHAKFGPSGLHSLRDCLGHTDRHQTFREGINRQFKFKQTTQSVACC